MVATGLPKLHYTSVNDAPAILKSHSIARRSDNSQLRGQGEAPLTVFQEQCRAERRVERWHRISAPLLSQRVALLSHKVRSYDLSRDPIAVLNSVSLDVLMLDTL